ncbi:MAG: DNA polymerase III subunit beta [Nitrospira sp.]|nr:DNA polymerase III subunit beta [Candidatus Manganitrophaceae bacterium]HIL35709.1 DNA polymerase III subunit beta [Candidatus Manganitrophaceae bacterium]
MKIEINRKDLLTGIQRVQGVVEKRNTMPILAHILMETSDDGIRLFATDLEIGIRGSYPAKILKPGKMTFSARKLYEIIREFPEGTVTITTQENHWVVIESGKSYFKIVGLPPDEFPSSPPPDSQRKILIDSSLFLALIRRTLFASGENDTRYILNGILLQLEKIKGNEQGIRFVATDGHRLALAEGLIKAGEDAEEREVIIPKKAILEIKKALEEDEGGEAPELLIGKSQLVFRRGSFVLTSRLMEGTYPNYKQVIPKGNVKKVTVIKKDLEGGLRRVSILAREKTNAIKFSLQEGGITLSSNNPEMGEASEEVVTSFKGEGLTTGFNARYFLDVLSVVKKEEVTLEFKDALSPCLIKEESNNFLAVIMPMRV